MRNRMRIAINTEILTEILTIGWNGDGEHCIEGLPEGAEFINMGYDPVYDRFHLTFQHESFPPTEPWQELPVLTPAYEKVAM